MNFLVSEPAILFYKNGSSFNLVVNGDFQKL